MKFITDKKNLMFISLILGILFLFPISVSAKESENVEIIYSDDGMIDYYTINGEGEYSYLEVRNFLISQGWSFK